MIGAIIGDLAAWTWEHDRNAFYRNLVSKDAKLSECGFTILLFSKGTISNRQYLWREIVESFKYSNSVLSDAINIKSEWRDYFFNERTAIPYHIKRTLCAAGIIASGWTETSRENAQKWISTFHGGKEEYYGTYLSEVIKRLRSGYTKNQALKDIPVINYWRSDNRKEFLSVVRFALLCFEESWDFTSAIYNAMQSTVDKHLAGMLAGGIAEAMYGCENMIIKQKFSSDYFFNHINIPNAIIKAFGETIHEIEQYKESVRVFFPKNRAQTNVERHFWTTVENPYKDRTITSKLRYRMLKAFDTGWENRFGVYLDDGWFYIYRSHNLLYRFKLICDGNYYRIISFQKSENKHATITAVDKVFSSLKNNWYSVSGEHKPKNLEFCKYYCGEDEIPEVLKDTIKGKFWYGEMMFVTNQIDMNEWEQSAEQCLKGLTGEKKLFFSKYSKEQQAIILYIETLFEKWCPCDNLKWIFDY
jgi:hypothetical protein